jgi:hypothetical protein
MRSAGSAGSQAAVDELGQRHAESLGDPPQDDHVDAVRAGLVWSWRNGEAMHLLWWDPEHEICRCKKKHT